MKSILMNKLAHSVTALSALYLKVSASDEFGDLCEPARDALMEVFETFGEIRAEEKVDETVRVCVDGDASLHVMPGMLVHSVKGKDVEVPFEEIDEHEMEGQLNTITIAGHEWDWGVMAVGAIVRAAEMLDEAKVRPTKPTGEKTLADAVYSLAEFIESMHPHAAKKELWTGTNFVLGANEVVGVLRAIPPMVAALAAETASLNPVGVYALSDGREVTGFAVAHHMTPEEAAKCTCKDTRRSKLLVTAAGEVWSIHIDDATGTCSGRKLKLEVHEPTGAYCKACDGPCKQSAGLISPSNDTTWFSMPTAVSVLETLQHYERFLGAGLAYPAVLDALAAVKRKVTTAQTEAVHSP